MKIYLSHSSAYDYEAELYGPLKASALSHEHEIFFPHDPENVDIDSKAIITDTDLLIAEVSYPSTGQGIELGRANSSNIPILCVYKSGSKISHSLQFVTQDFLEYQDIDDLLRQLATRLTHCMIDK